MLANVCKVCTALDTLPDDDAARLDRLLADARISARDIAEGMTAAGQPASRMPVGRHRRGQCDLGLNYYMLAVA